MRLSSVGGALALAGPGGPERAVQRPGLINTSQLTASQPACQWCCSCCDSKIMSGFDDDFGEMVGGREEAGDLTEDPAAEFLAREQEQLGELETELGPLSGW